MNQTMTRRTFLSLLPAAWLAAGCGRKGGDEQPLFLTDTGSPGDPVIFAAVANAGIVLDDGAVVSSLWTAIDRAGVDFAVDLGNRLPIGVPPGGTPPLWESIDRQREDFVRPLYPVAGVQDIFDATAAADYHRRYGPTWYAFARNGLRFVMLDTQDEAFDRGFGITPHVGDAQLAWMKNLFSSPGGPTVVFMNRPLWHDAPSEWREKLLPLFRTGQVSLIVTGYKRGLIDWGDVDGMRAVSTGCVGPVEAAGPGLFPHALLATLRGDTVLFQVLTPEGTAVRDIDITPDRTEAFEHLAGALVIPSLSCGNAWQVNQSVEITLANTFDRPLTGMIEAAIAHGTRWNIAPEPQTFTVEPGVTKSIKLRVEGSPPDMGPLPVVHTELFIGDTCLRAADQSLSLTIPRPRRGDLIPVVGRAASLIPYRFSGESLKIPVDIETDDTCGRLVIYREPTEGMPECIHMSPLAEFRPGVNTFSWNGRDLAGHTVTEGPLSYRLVLYNRRAPVTWIADGPPQPSGTFRVERTLQGLVARTHTDDSLVSFPIAGRTGDPTPEVVHDLNGCLEGLAIRGYALGAGERAYLTTEGGIVCVKLRGGAVAPDPSFGQNGYVAFTGLRGKQVGSPILHTDRLYVGIGGGRGSAPRILVLDSHTGADIATIDLGSFFGPYADPPALQASGRGLFCGHPDEGILVHLTHDGEVIWINDSGDERIGDIDTDGRSHTYGVGVDQFGFSYITTPGTSARCGVLGPDGHGLFRVILVQLPGLRTSAIYPLIEGRPTDGLYFVTRSGDRPYVFHVPYTILTGSIAEPGARLGN